MKILLIEEDRKAADYLAGALRERGHAVEQVHSGLIGLGCAKSDVYSAIVLERTLPGLDGITLVRQLRREGSMVPVMFLTARDSVEDRVEGLGTGADDYLTKPVALPELLARLQAITRRAGAQVGTETRATCLRAGDLEMDLIGRAVHRNGRQIDLQPREFRLLEYMLRMAGRAVTRAMLLENVWNINFDPHTNIVETHISRLRKKVDYGARSALIRTVRGFGYVLESN